MRYFLLLVLLASSAILVDCLLEVSIDCGFSGDDSYYDDRTFKIYAPDAEYIDTGANHEIDEFYVTGQPVQAQNLRSFPDGVRNCYTINDVTQGDKYLIRASFLYGYYDGGQQMRDGRSLTFDLYFGVNFWQTMNITGASHLYISEIITLASSDYFSICLVKSGDGIPFISALELRRLDSELYKDVNQSVSLRLSERKSMGLNRTIRFPDDIYDRIWQPGYTSCEATSYCRDVRQNPTVLTTTALVDLGSDDAYKVPLAIMQSADVSSDNNTLILRLSNGDDVVMAPMFYVYLHFAELRAPKGNESSIFQLRVPGSRRSLINISLEYLVARHIQFIYQANSDPSTFYLNLTRVPGSLPPLLNAMEAYSYVDLTKISTDQGDVDAMMMIKRLLYHTEWQGDPCVPVQFAWNETKCSFPISTPPRVTSLDLFNRGLKGDIPAAIGNLSAITYLNLSRNTFTGPIPPFLANLNSLQTLDLSGNQLDGSLIDVLCNRQANGSLRLRLEDNPCYFQGICVCKRKQKHSIHVLAISIVVAAVIVIVLLSVFFLRGRRGKKEPSKRQPKWRDTIGSSFHTGSPHFTYQDLRTITNNFERVIGKGGFGTVYYGRLHDGTEVAVKMQKRFLAIEEGISEDFMTEELGSDSHGIKEFQVEAQLLSRVHHRNLVALVGYCKDGHSLGLVFEYAAQGSLKDHLSDKNNTGRVLSWRERLRIAVDAAQGLEYLHKGCKPPIIHRDVKTSNILLSHNFEAKIADFGLSKAFLTDAHTHVSTQAVVGTPGYVDPDYHSTYRLTEKSDVYSFGIVLLELVTGLPAVLKFLETGHILQWVRQGLAQGTVADVVDPRLQQQQQQCDMYSVRRVVDLALHCTALNSNERPTMTEVVMQLKESLQLEIVSESSTRPYGGDVDVNQSGSTASTSINLTELSGPSAR
ncbi:LRR receptor-like serine/threonine-protein kinase IOS1 [Musa acuminata AAA Group]|uniref:LRR receptor-like serine/threonine-protein kinase IOS1 n=1 Tax=Musa acuminata AAA Group TaxID=214697 RepID=UPI0031D00374